MLGYFVESLFLNLIIFPSLFITASIQMHITKGKKITLKTNVVKDRNVPLWFRVYMVYFFIHILLSAIIMLIFAES